MKLNYRNLRPGHDRRPLPCTAGSPPGPLAPELAIPLELTWALALMSTSLRNKSHSLPFTIFLIRRPLPSSQNHSDELSLQTPPSPRIPRCRVLGVVGVGDPGKAQ